MNERIHDLAMLARKHFPKTETSGEFWVLDEEKFAELIVKECMSIAQEYDGSKLGGPGLIIAMRIEQHFGVTE